jgi:hypothetical protein
MRVHGSIRATVLSPLSFTSLYPCREKNEGHSLLKDGSRAEPERCDSMEKPALNNKIGNWMSLVNA